jgi:hypothetical protein
MTARRALELILQVHGLSLNEDGLIVSQDSGDVVGELLTVKYDEKGGLRYSIKMNTAIDYIDLDLDIGDTRES